MPKLSAADVKYELDNLRHDLSLEETEDNWEKIAKAMTAFMKIGESGGYDASPSEVSNALRNSHRPITSAMNSERTRLSGAALDLIGSVVSGLARDFEQLMPLFMPPLLALCARTNKVVIARARSAISNIIEVAQLVSVLPYFVQSIKDKSITLRLVIAEGTLACLNSCNPPDLEKEARARDIESIIRGTARDANPDVRKVSRKVFETYKILLPSRVESFTAPLSPTMKKYLDIKSNHSITTSKSTSNLRANLNLNPDPKPLISSSVSTSVVGRPNGHTRTASTSTINGCATSQTRNLATTLTRVARKEPNSAVPTPYVPVRPAQPSRVVSERTDAQKASSTISSASRAPIYDSKRAAPPLRSQPSTISRTTSTTAIAPSSAAPRRLQLSAETKSAVASATSQSLTSSGPRRVPMPPPPPPAPKKQPDGPKRPASRVDNASSTASRPPVLPAPTKKTVAITSSIKVRAPSTKPPIPRYNPSANPIPRDATTAGSSTAAVVKPLAIPKAKPGWGSAPASKPVPVASHKNAVKAIVKKPSSLVVKSAPASGPVKKGPITPAAVALPPSPPPEETDTDIEGDAEKVVATTDEKVANNAHQCISPRSSLILEVEITVADDDTDRTIQNYTQTTVSPPDTRLPTPTDEVEITSPEHVLVEKQYLHSQELHLPTSNENLLPRTPQNNLLPKPVTGAGLISKTPISALLSSIERGFQYSPTTPLSPADSYLPGPDGLITYSHETHAPRIEGPMQPFNYALHTSTKGGLFGTKFTNGPSQEELVCGDIGVVDLNEHNKQYNTPTSLPLLDDVGRHAFVEINK